MPLNKSGNWGNGLPTTTIPILVAMIRTAAQKSIVHPTPHRMPRCCQYQTWPVLSKNLKRMGQLQYVVAPQAVTDTEHWVGNGLRFAWPNSTLGGLLGLSSHPIQ